MFQPWRPRGGLPWRLRWGFEGLRRVASVRVGEAIGRCGSDPALAGTRGNYNGGPEVRRRRSAGSAADGPDWVLASTPRTGRPGGPQGTRQPPDPHRRAAARLDAIVESARRRGSWRCPLATDRSGAVGVRRVSRFNQQTDTQPGIAAMGFRKLSARPRHHARIPMRSRRSKKVRRQLGGDRGARCAGNR